MSPLLMAAQRAEPVLSFVEGLRQGPPVQKSAHPLGLTGGVDPQRGRHVD